MKFNILIMGLISSILLSSCHSSKENETDLSYYSEKYRPQIHFSPEKNWMNDPNGLVYLDGEYHLFYQYYPDSNVWGPMHWGHAISKDLMHWQHLPIALFPDSLGLIFSGSTVYDKDNTSGLGTKETPALVAIFTYHSLEKEKANRSDFQSQGIAFSIDKGRTWTKYKSNPVLPNTDNKKNFRDPKVFWHKETVQWIMTLAVGDHIEFYGSKNLVNWEFLSEFGQGLIKNGVYECPDLFQLTVGNSDQKKWVLIISTNPGGFNDGSGTHYFVGDFNGKAFTSLKNESKTLDFGKDNYAGVSFSNLPNDQNRQVLIGWMSNWQYATTVPTTKWRSTMTLPRELSLIDLNGDLVVCSNPVAEFNKLVIEKIQIVKDETLLEDAPSVSLEMPKFPLMVEMTITRENAADGFEFEFSNKYGEKLIFGLDGQYNQFYIDRNNAGESSFSKDFRGKHIALRTSKNKEVLITLIIDAASAEVFLDNGTTVMTEIFFPKESYGQFKFSSKAKKTTINSITVAELKSVWKQ